MKYLKKKKLHAVAKIFIGCDVPPLKDCTYKYFNGLEWLSFYSWQIIFSNLGQRIRVLCFDDDNNVISETVYSQKIAEPILLSSYAYRKKVR